MKPCGLVLDVDGTLTTDRRGFELDLELVTMLKQVARRLPVILVTGNALPVVVGLARYLGLIEWPQIGENGCLIFYKNKIIHVCSRSTRNAARIVEEELAEVVEPSWQNSFRIYDYAFTLKESWLDKLEQVRAQLREILDKHGYKWVKVSFSGYAFHLRPPEASKGMAVARALSMLDVDPKCCVGIGDSEMDIELKEADILLAAVSNADEELIKRADIKLGAPSSQGVKVFIKRTLF